jgi:hypothetical protein
MKIIAALLTVYLNYKNDSMKQAASKANPEGKNLHNHRCENLKSCDGRSLNYIILNRIFSATPIPVIYCRSVNYT